MAHVLSGIRREVLIETDDLVFKLNLSFDICRMSSEVPQIDEDANVLNHMSTCH